jgi:hypothetical protein
MMRKLLFAAIAILALLSPAATQNLQSVGAANVTSASATGTVTIGGTSFVSLDTVALTFTNSSVTGLPVTVTYTLGGAETLTTIGTGLKNLINASAPLAAVGITATNVAGVISINQAGVPAGATTVSSGGVTGTGNETVTLSAPSTGVLNAVSGTATLNQSSGVITTEVLTTIAGATYTLTVGCPQAQPKSVVQASLGLGTNSTGDPTLNTVTPGTGVLTFVITNRHASAVLNGTLKVAFSVFN